MKDIDNEKLKPYQIEALKTFIANSRPIHIIRRPKKKEIMSTTQKGECLGNIFVKLFSFSRFETKSGEWMTVKDIVQYIQDKECIDISFEDAMVVLSIIGATMLKDHENKTHIFLTKKNVN